jgi:hypothetical protein
LNCEPNSTITGLFPVFAARQIQIAVSSQEKCRRSKNGGAGFGGSAELSMDAPQGSNDKNTRVSEKLRRDPKISSKG